MRIGEEIYITKALLDTTRYLKGIEEMHSGMNKAMQLQDDFNRHQQYTAAASLVASAALAHFAEQSVTVAGKLDMVQKAMAAVEGQQKAIADMKFTDTFAQHSMFQYLDLADAAKRLALQNVSVKDTLGDVADVAAASGKPLAQVAQLYDALLGGGRVGLALSARGGFAQYGISTREIFAAAGKTYTPGMKLQDAMTPQEVKDAVHRALIVTGRSGLNEKLARTTDVGTTGMVNDAQTRIMDAVGKSLLPAKIEAMNHLADAMNAFATVMKNHPRLTEGAILGGVGGTAALGIYSSVKAYRGLKDMMNLARIAGEAERAGEKAKGPVAAAEGNAVNLLSGKYGGLRGSLLKAGEASLGTRAATTGLTGTLAAGIGTAGLYAVAIAGAAFDIGLLTDSFIQANQASRDFEASLAAVAKAKALGYDVAKNGGKVTGYDALPVWQQVGYQVLNTESFGGVDWLTDDAYTPGNAGITATTDAQSRALAKKHGRVKGGVMDMYIAHQKAQADAAKHARLAQQQIIGATADKYELPPALDFKLKQDERRVALLKEMGGHEQMLKGARGQEIADLNTAAGLLERQSALATDIKKKYDLLDQAADDRQKAKLLGLEVKGKDGRDKMDKTIATILGGGGLSESDVLKRAGISTHNMRHLAGGHVPKNPLEAAIKALSKRTQIINIRIGDKPFVQLKTEIVDDALHEILRLTETSGKNALFGQ